MIVIPPLTVVPLQFVDDYEPTKLDSYQTMMDYQGQEVDVQITDTAGLFVCLSVRSDHWFERIAYRPGLFVCLFVRIERKYQPGIFFCSFLFVRITDTVHSVVMRAI